MDANDLPLAFNINSSGANEQVMLRPLEKMIGKRPENHDAYYHQIFYKERW